MREIKFRVWDEKYNQWDTSPLTIHPAESVVKQGRVIQQSTDLKDKNGKEIYEGDILKFKSFDSWNDKVGFYYNSQVFYCTPLARFRHSFKNFDNICGTDFDLKDEMEVIGNIFENPELCAK